MAVILSWYCETEAPTHRRRGDGTKTRGANRPIATGQGGSSKLGEVVMDRRRSPFPNVRTTLRGMPIIVALATLVVALLGSAAPALAASQAILSAGPLTRVQISDDLNCTVDHTGDIYPEFYNGTACGTLVAVGGTLFGPVNIPAGGAAAPRTGFTPISQSTVQGAGTGADPFRIVTVVGLGSTGVQVTETDSYIVGQETYRTDVAIANSSGVAADAILYRAGDCYLQNSDQGFGAFDATTGAVSCVAGVDNGNGIVPGTRIEQWYPLSAGSSYYEAYFSSVWSHIGTQTAFPDTCEQCANYIDNGAGLSWSVSIPAGGSVTRSNLTVFSPLGVTPLTTAKTASLPSVAAGGADTYTITVSNPNIIAATLASISDTLPAGFSYTSGSTTGATTTDPTVVGQVLTWNGPFPVAASGSVSLTFGVTVSSTAGMYTNVAEAAAQGQFTVVGTGPTAPVTVTAPTQAHLTLGKSVDNTGGGTALATAWTLSATGPTPISGSDGDASITNAAVDAGTYTLAESGGPSGYTAGSWACTGGTLTGSSLVLAPGDTASCSITNTFVPPSPAHLTLTKSVDNTGGGTALATAWTLSATGQTTISGKSGDASITHAAVDAGTYTLAESGGPSGYTAGAWSCTGGTLTGRSLVLAAGDTASCSIRNTFVVTIGKISPTDTTCQQYVAGTAATLPRINYRIRGGVIHRSINPGVFFYFSTVKVSAGDVITTSQSTTNSSGKLFLLLQGHAWVWDSSCDKVGKMTPTSGGATGTFTVRHAGTYILQLQYFTKSISRTAAPSPINPTYTFDTAINGNEVVPDTTSIRLHRR